MPRKRNRHQLIVPGITRASLVALALVATGCGDHSCSEVGCLDELSILYANETGKLDDGEYVSEVTIGGQTQTCAFTVTNHLAPDAGPCVTVTAPTFEIVDLQPADHIEFTLTVNGQLKVRHSLDPAYKTVQPNGPECEPTCRQAVVDIQFR